MIDWNACTEDPHWLVQQIECHPGLVNLSAAIFTGMAAGVALWASVRALKQEQRRRDAAAKALAYRLMPAVIFLIQDVKLIRNYMSEDSFQMAFTLGADAADRIRLQHGGLPEGAMEQLGVLPPVQAANVGQLEQFLLNFDRAVDLGLGGETRENAKTRQHWESVLNRHLDAIEKLALEIKEWAGELTDQVVGPKLI